MTESSFSSSSSSSSSSSLQNRYRNRNRAVADALAGVAASLVSLWTFYPIEVWKTNAQAGACAKRKSLFQGCTVKTLHTASSSFVYFYIYSWIVRRWTSSSSRKSSVGEKSPKISPMTRLFLSAIAAMLNTFITLPLDTISSRMVTNRSEREEGFFETNENNSSPSSSGDAAKSKHRMDKVFDQLELLEGEAFYPARSSSFDNEKKDTELPTIYEKRLMAPPIIEEDRGDDIRHLWKGLAPALLLCTNPSINYTVFDSIKNRILTRRYESPSFKPNTNLTMMDAFLLGLISKFVATIATYPLIRAKVMLMVTAEKSMVACLCRSYKENGVKGLYKGCDWQLIHTVLKSALMMMVKEKITLSTHRMIIGETKR